MIPSGRKTRVLEGGNSGHIQSGADCRVGVTLPMCVAVLSGGPENTEYIPLRAPIGKDLRYRPASTRLCSGKFFTSTDTCKGRGWNHQC